MASSFFELSVASTGLFTSKGALNVVGHNIANAGTVGYSRQVAQVRARNPLNYQNGRGMVGTGSEMYGIGQMRNFYLDTKYWTNSGVLGEFTSKSSQNRLLQATLNETDETGFNKMLNDIFGIIKKDLVTDSSSMTARLSLINSTQALTQYFNTTYASLEKQQMDINHEIKGMVSTINNLGVQIQNLNKQIYVSELDGSVANDLRDSRALLIDELSKYVNVEAREVEMNKDLLTGKCEKRFQVSINGYDFVDHYNINTLDCVERTVKNNPEDVEGLYDIYWNNGVKFNSDFSLKTMAGQLKGLLVTRDGNNQNCPTAEIDSFGAMGTATNGTGGMKVTFVTDSSNRDDWQEPGSIVIEGKSYSYDNLEVTYSTDSNGKLVTTISVDIPPRSGKMTVGNNVILYKNLTINAAGDITFETDGYELLENGFGKNVKIGDMILGGTVTSTGSPVTISGSDAAANINGLVGSTPTDPKVKVGHSVDYKGIPYFMSKLNTFVRGLALSFNLGRDVNGNQLEGITGHYYAYNLMKYDDEANANTGYNFFTYNESPNTAAAGYGEEYLNYYKITAGNFSVSKELLENPSALACALSENPDISDYLAIDQLGSLMHNPHLFDEGEFGNFIESIIGELGIITEQAITFESNYTDVTAAVDYQRMSISSVNLDEEMASMVYWQQIYNACAKMISTLDGIYDTTINRLGS